jgi:hypothetical protein
MAGKSCFGRKTLRSLLVRYQLPKPQLKIGWIQENGVIFPQGRPPRLSKNEINLLHELIEKLNFDMKKTSFDDLTDDLARKRAGNDFKWRLSSSFSRSKTNRRVVQSYEPFWQECRTAYGRKSCSSVIRRKKFRILCCCESLND